MLNRLPSAAGRGKPAPSGAVPAEVPQAAPQAATSAVAPTPVRGDRSSAVSRLDLAVPDAPNLADLDWSAVEGRAAQEGADAPDAAAYRARLAALQEANRAECERFSALCRQKRAEAAEEELKLLKRRIDQAIASGDFTALASLSGLVKSLMGAPGMADFAGLELGLLLMKIRDGMAEVLKPLRVKMDSAVASGDPAMLVKLAGLVSALAATPGLDASIYKDLKLLLVDLREAFKQVLAPLREKMDSAVASGDFEALLKLADVVGTMAATPNVDPIMLKELRELLVAIREAFPMAMKSFDRKMQAAIASGDIAAMQALAAFLNTAADCSGHVDPTMRTVLRRRLTELREAIRRQMKLDQLERRAIAQAPKP